MSKIRKRDYIKRNFTARKDLNRHADVFKDKKHSPKGGRHGEKDRLKKEIEDAKENSF